MTLSSEWNALQREAQLAAEQVATGVTALGRAHHAQPGLYSQAFFGVSIGLERMGKLIFVGNHAIENSGGFPRDSDLRRIGHDLRELLPMCATIGETINPQRAYASRPADSIHQGIEQTLSEFASKTRYYNLNHITGAAGQQADPITMWWQMVGIPICERHYSDRQRKKDEANAVFMDKMLGDDSIVIHHGEDGAEIDNVGDLVARAGATTVVQKYGRLYTLQIVRWLAAILYELSHFGAYQKRIEPLLGLNDPFAIFGKDDRYLRDRKTWSIYRL